MTVLSHTAINATSFQLAAALERYEEHLGHLLADPFNTDGIRRACDDLDGIQRFSAKLPGLSVAAVALRLSHAELMMALARRVDGLRVRAEAGLESAWAGHRSCIDDLRGLSIKPLLKSQR